MISQEFRCKYYINKRLLIYDLWKNLWIVWITECISPHIASKLHFSNKILWNTSHFSTDFVIGNAGNRRESCCFRWIDSNSLPWYHTTLLICYFLHDYVHWLYNHKFIIWCCYAKNCAFHVTISFFRAYDGISWGKSRKRGWPISIPYCKWAATLCWAGLL